MKNFIQILFLNLLILINFPFLAYANNAKDIPDFIVLCESLKYGNHEAKKSSKLVWSKELQKLTITGDGIKNDDGELTSAKAFGSNRVIFASFEDSLTIYSKHINMTFRESFFNPPNNKTEYIRTFRFNVPKPGEKGSLSTSDISDVNGIVSVNLSFFATSCDFTWV